MSTSTEHERWADAVASYLLGALPAGEREAFEAHMESCAVCHEEAEQLRVAVEALPATPEQLVPPPALKDRIMAVVNSEAELLQAAGSRADLPEQPAPRRPRFTLGRWSLRPGMAVGATAALLIVGGAAGLLAGGAFDGDSPVRARTVLAEVDAAADSRARLIVREEHSTLVAANLPHPGAGRVYQVWLKRPNRSPEPTDALFGVRRDGSASVDVPGSLEDVEAVLVTSEPDGGSQAPTRQPIIRAVPA